MLNKRMRRFLSASLAAVMTMTQVVPTAEVMTEAPAAQVETQAAPETQAPETQAPETQAPQTEAVATAASTEDAAAVAKEVKETSAETKEEAASEQEDAAKETIPYIVFLPSVEGVTYSYDAGHYSSEFSTGDYTILLYEEGETVTMNASCDYQVHVVACDSQADFINPEDIENGNISFVMPGADLEIQFVNLVEETEAPAEEAPEQASQETPAEQAPETAVPEEDQAQDAPAEETPEWEVPEWEAPVWEDVTEAEEATEAASEAAEAEEATEAVSEAVEVETEAAEEETEAVTEGEFAYEGGVALSSSSITVDEEALSFTGSVTVSLKAANSGDVAADTATTTSIFAFPEGTIVPDMTVAGNAVVADGGETCFTVGGEAKVESVSVNGTCVSVVTTTDVKDDVDASITMNGDAFKVEKTEPEYYPIADQEAFTLSEKSSDGALSMEEVFGVAIEPVDNETAATYEPENGVTFTEEELKNLPNGYVYAVKEAPSAVKADDTIAISSVSVLSSETEETTIEIGGVTDLAVNLKEAGLTTKLAADVKGYNMIDKYQYSESYMPKNWIDPEYKKGLSTNIGRKIEVNGKVYYVHCAEPNLDAPGYRTGDNEYYDCFVIGTAKANGKPTNSCNGLSLEDQKLLAKALYYLYGGPVQGLGSPTSINLTGTDGKTYNLVNMLKGYGMTDKVHFATMSHYLIGSIYSVKSESTWTNANNTKYLSDDAIDTYIPKVKAALAKLPDPGLISLSKTNVTATQSAGKFTSGSITYNCGLRENSISTKVLTGDKFIVNGRTYTAGQTAVIYGGETFVIESTSQNQVHSYHFSAKYNTDFAGYYINTVEGKQDLVFGVNTNAGLDLKLTLTSLDGYIEIKKAADVTVNGETSQILKAWADTHSMAGATYGVYNNSACTDAYQKCEITLDANGYGKSSALSPGAYWVKEKGAPSGYAIDATGHGVTVTAANTATVNTTDRPLQGTAHLQKVVEADANGAKISTGIKFTLTSKANARDAYEAVTDANGKAQWPIIPAGDYTLTEEVPKYYAAVPPRDVTITDGGDLEIYAELTAEGQKVFPNVPTKKYVRVLKTDSNTNGPVEGAVFTIAPEGGANLALSVEKGTQVDATHFATAADGMITFKTEFTGGKYVLTETSAPTGYGIAAPVTFEVVDDVTTVAVDVSDVPHVGKISVVKVDAESSQRCMNGYKFEVSVKEDIVDQAGNVRTMADGTQLVAGTVVATIETDDNGYAETSNLYDGTYTVKEVEIAPWDGLTINPNTFDVTVSDNGTTVPFNVTVPNTPNQVTLKKTCKGGVLEGVVFRFTNTSYQEPQMLSDDEDNTSGTMVGVRTRDFVTDANGELHISHLPVGDYEVVEVEGKPGYVPSGEIFTFSVDDQGLINGETSYEMEVYNGPIVIKIHKYDIVEGEGGKELVGAQMVLTDKATGKVIDSWTSGYDKDGNLAVDANGDAIPHEIEAIPAGDYVLTETAAPEGYERLENVIEFTVLETTQIQTVNVANIPHRDVEISKKELTKTKIDGEWVDGAELPGATLAVYDADGNEVEKWVSTSTPHKFKLPSGEYELRETVPADGFTTAESIKFTITKRDTTGDYEVTKVEMKDKPTEIKVSKTDIVKGPENGELPGATLTILDENKQQVYQNGQPLTWVSTTEPHYIQKLKIGTYYLREVIAPTGYSKATDVQFVVTDSRGTIQQVEMKDSPYREVDFSKRTFTKTEKDGKWVDGEELPGAKLKITDEDGNIIKDENGNEMAWTSTEEPRRFKLPAGTYKMVETQPADGYTTAESITFTVTERATLGDEEIQKVTMHDKPTQVEISKEDITDSKPVVGAVLVIKDKNGKELHRWVTKKEPHYIEKLPIGKYTLTEITAPDGYEVAETMEFEVKDTGEIQHVTMYDSPSSDKTPKTPKTGDDLNMGLILLLSAMALVLLAGGSYLFFGKKKRS